MRRAFGVLVIGAGLAMPLAAGAEAPSEAGATKLTNAVRTYGPESLAKPGMLRVAPDQDGYRLVFDTARLVEGWLSPMTVKQATPWVMEVSERADRAWSFTSTGPFSVMASHIAGGRTASLAFSSESRRLDGEFDPATFFPRTIELVLTKTALGLRSARATVRMNVGAIDISSRVRDLPDGHGDLDATFLLQDASITQGAFPQPESTISAARIEGSYNVDQLDLAGFAAMHRFWKATATGKQLETLTAAERAEAKAILARHLPTLSAFGGSFVATGLSTSSGGKGLKAAKLDYESRWDGLAGQATLTMAARVTDVGIDPGVWPKQLEPILPKEAGIRVRASGFDMAAFWKDVALMRTEKEAVLLPRDHLTATVVPSGALVVSMTEGSLRSSVYDLGVTGQLDVPMAPERPITGSVMITARNFDGTIKYLDDNKGAVPIFRRAAFFAQMLKGLAKAGPDGALAWDVRLTDTGKITVNGQPLPM